MSRTAILLTALAWLVATNARAQNPACEELSGNVIYGIGGSAQTPFIGQIAPRLRETADPDHQLTIVYAEPGACYGPAAFDPSLTDAERAISTISPSATARYWNAGNSTPQSCTLAAETLADFASARNYADFCPGQTLHEGLGDFIGPVGTANVIVPIASTQNSISAEALYFLLKFGDAAQLEPWREDYLVYQSPISAVALFIARAVGITGEIERGHYPLGSASALSIIAQGGIGGGIGGGDNPITVPNPDATLGFVSGENAENNRNVVRTLAYQHFGQTCAHWPDSGSGTLDKINVRTGRYALWQALHFFAPITGAASVLEDIEDPHVRRLVGYATGELPPPPELPILDIVIDNYNVPQCAMQVRRESELGPQLSYAPPAPCGCYFEARATGRTSCSACETAGDCEGGAGCHHGFCEP